MDKIDKINQNLDEVMQKVKALKQENADLTAQLEKERKDKEAMGELLKEYEKQLNTEKWQASTNENLPEFLRISKVQNKIKSVLTNSGITI